MGVYYETIPDSLIEWCRAQKMFWVSTAPLSSTGHVNVSPKGGSYFGIPNNKTFWYMDLTGSGNETISHLHEPHNGRITIMFNAFEGPPKIVRFWGTGRVLEKDTPAFNQIVSEESIECIPGTRSIIVVDIHQVGGSCGFSVPYYDFKEFRPTLNLFFEKKEAKFLKGNQKESMDQYWGYKNAWSMDGLPGMQRGQVAAKKHAIEPIKKMVGPLAPKSGVYKDPRNGLHIEHVVIALLMALVAVLLVTHPAVRSEYARNSVQNVVPQLKAILDTSKPRVMRK